MIVFGVSRARRPAGSVGGPRGEKHLAERCAVKRHGAPEPVRASEHVVRVHLGDLLDHPPVDDAEVDRLARDLAESLEIRAGDADKVGLGVAAQRVAHEGVARA